MDKIHQQVLISLDKYRDINSKKQNIKLFMKYKANIAEKNNWNDIGRRISTKLYVNNEDRGE